MKIKLMHTIKIGNLLLGALLTSGLALAQAGEKTEANVSIPATVEAIWESIDQRTDELDHAIQTNVLGEVHHHAYAIRDLVTALPGRSKSLPPDKLAQVKANVAFVSTLAQRLDASGDAKDKAGTEANFKKLKDILNSIRKNYPASNKT